MCVLPPQIQDVAEQGVMFVGFLQQPGGGPCYLGNWDPEELSSLHSSPSPIHRHPFSANTSPTDPTEGHQNGVEPLHRPFEPQELDHENVGRSTQPAEPGFSRLKPSRGSELHAEESSEAASQMSFKESLESTNQPQNHGEPGADAPQRRPSRTTADNHGSQLLPERWQERSPSKESTEQLFNQRERQDSSSDSWHSSPDLQRNHEKRPSSVCADGQSRVTTHNNNNHIRLKTSEKDKNVISPPPQASE